MFKTFTHPIGTTEASWNLSTCTNFCFHLTSLAMFAHGGKFEFWWQGVFNSALYQLSESYSCEVNPQLSSYSALLAAAISTQSLTQCLRRLKEWATTLTNAKTYPTEDMFFLCFWFYFVPVSQQWSTDRMKCVWAHLCAELRVAQGRKSISLADTKSITQHWG